MSRRPVGAYLLGALLVTTGVLHFAIPKPYEGLIPKSLGSPRAWVYGSGVAELACAAAVLHPVTRRRGGWATVLLFLGVFPGNVTMALRSGGHSGAYQALTWLRLPLQVPLILWARAVARRADRDRSPQPLS